MKKLLKLLIGWALLPLVWASSRTLYFLLIATSSELNPWALPVGFMLSVVGFFVLPQAIRTYVLGHELTHALWALLMGGRVGRMHVSQEGGHVELSKSNFLISLAPYFFPFYTALVIALWQGLGFIFHMDGGVSWWVGLVGLTWGFHVTFTVLMLSQHQPDVQEHGRLFSYVVIYLSNIFFVSLWVVAWNEMTYGGSWNIFFNESKLAYGSILDTLMNGIALIRGLGMG